jgi:ATP-dependent DNA ligase
MPTLVAKPPEGDGWIHEVKHDGYRAQLMVAGGRATILTRNGFDWTDRFPADQLGC